MAGRARDILVRFLGDEKDLIASQRRVQGEVGKTGQGLGLLGQNADRAVTKLKGMAAGALLAAVAGLGKLLGEMAAAAAEDAKSVETLTFAIRQNTDATDAQIESNEKWISSMQLATLVADTELRQAQQSLIVSGATLEESQRIIATSLDIAAARGKEFMTVIEAMVKAQNGQTVGLGRLGIATKSASGETLTFDQILQNASDTMGGSAAEGAATLAGAMERAKIIIQEANEAAGADVTGPWSQLGDDWAIFTTKLKGGNAQLAILNREFNDLIRNGVDPFEDKTKSLVDVLHEMLEVTDVNANSVKTLRLMLGLTDDEVRHAADGIRTFGAEWGFSKEQVEALLILLRDEAPGVAGEVHDSWMNVGRAAGFMAGEIPKSVPVIRTLTTELNLAAEAGQNVADSILAATDPVFAGVNAWKSYAGALEEARKDGKLTKEEQLELLEAQLRFNAAMGDVSPAEYERFMEAIQLSTGKSREEVELLLTTLGLIDGKTFTATVQANIKMSDIGNRPGSIPGRDIFGYDAGGVVPGPTGKPTLAVVHGGEEVLTPKQRQARSRLPEFDAGGVVPGPVGSPQPIVAHGGETILPTHKERVARRRARSGAPIIVMFDQYSNHIEAYRNAQEIARIQDQRARQKAL